MVMGDRFSLTGDHVGHCAWGRQGEIERERQRYRDIDREKKRDNQLSKKMGMPMNECKYSELIDKYNMYV